MSGLRDWVEDQWAMGRTPDQLAELLGVAITLVYGQDPNWRALFGNEWEPALVCITCGAQVRSWHRGLCPSNEPHVGPDSRKGVLLREYEARQQTGVEVS